MENIYLEFVGFFGMFFNVLKSCLIFVVLVALIRYLWRKGSK